MMMQEKTEEVWDYILLPNEEGKIPALQIDLRTLGLEVGESVTFHVKYHANVTANALSQCVYSTTAGVANPQQIGTTAGVHTLDVTATRQNVYLGYAIVFSGFYSYSTGATNRSVQGDYIKIRIVS